MVAILDPIINLILHVMGFSNQMFTERRKKNFYLRTLRDSCRFLNGDWVGKLGSDSTGELNLPNSAFVPLNLANTRGYEMTLREVISQCHRVVIQGPPGAGKTTLLRYITWIMAQSLLPDGHRQLSERHLAVKPHIPIRVELKGYRTSKRLLHDMILSASDGVLTTDLLDKSTKDGVIYLLDGLDEVPPDAADQLIDEIMGLTHRFSESRFVVSTRIATYRTHALAPVNFDVYTVQPLNPHQQTQLILRYFEQWSRRSGDLRALPAEQQANELLGQLAGNQRLSRLASNPLLLALVAVNCYLGPQTTGTTDRSKIYEMCIENLLRRRLPTSSDITDHINVLAELAWRMQTQRSYSVMPSSEVIEVLRHTAETRNIALARHLDVDEIEKQWGLLIRSEEVQSAEYRFSFAQQNFQDYLAARAVHLFPADYWPELQSHLRENRWHEVVLLYAGMPADNTEKLPLSRVLEALGVPNSSLSDDDAILAGACIASADLSSDELQKPPVPATLQRLLHIVRSSPDPITRSKALDVLTVIVPTGIEKVLSWMETEARNNMDILPEYFNQIGGDARQILRIHLIKQIESSEQVRQRIHAARLLAQIGDTRPGSTVCMTSNSSGKTRTELRAGMYPVTNAEYDLYVQATRSAPPLQWMTIPYSPAEANCPVSGVSLEEAKAYCNWLAKRLGHRVYVPTAAQWEQIARGGPRDYRYPWGNDLIRANGNYKHECSGVTPIGVFHEGQNSLGVNDLMGNVWEWTTTTDQGKNVVKGGAWDTTDMRDGIEMRQLVEATARESNIGFRALHLMSEIANEI